MRSQQRLVRGCVNETAVGCTQDILRKSNCLDRLSKIPWVVLTFIVIEGEDIIAGFCSLSRWKELSKELGSKILSCGDRSYWKTFKPIASLMAKEKIEITADAYFPYYHRQDQESIKIIKDSLDDFSGVSGLKPNLTRGKAKIAWKTLYKPKCQGGLGFKDLGMWNEVLLTKHVWNIAAHKESLWVKWVHMIKLRGRRLWEVNPKFNNSWMWKVILGLRDKAKEHIEFKVGNRRSISVWYNKWNDIGPIC
ncbi:hypothetical protein Tco_0861446 [Tanacetum coccineum]|uniref:Uncharacterized protein n=1 Tax=Tanacetum coccineum TaxID=301880 RepID=A0ABQ5BJH4_9ASTR